MVCCCSSIMRRSAAHPLSPYRGSRIFLSNGLLLQPRPPPVIWHQTRSCRRASSTRLRSKRTSRAWSDSSLVQPPLPRHPASLRASPRRMWTTVTSSCLSPSSTPWPRRRSRSCSTCCRSSSTSRARRRRATVESPGRTSPACGCGSSSRLRRCPRKAGATDALPEAGVESRLRTEEPVKRLKEFFFHLFATEASAVDQLSGASTRVFLLSPLDLLLYLCFNDEAAPVAGLVFRSAVGVLPARWLREGPGSAVSNSCFAVVRAHGKLCREIRPAAGEKRRAVDVRTGEVHEEGFCKGDTSVEHEASRHGDSQHRALTQQQQTAESTLSSNNFPKF